MAVCSVCGSDRNVSRFQKQGDPLCLKHYRQVMRRGKIYRTFREPNKIIDCGTHYEMELMDNQSNVVGYTKFDKHHLDEVTKLKWHMSWGYAVNRGNHQNTYLHRMIAGTPKGLFTDHIDQDRLNNLDNNLTVCTKSGCTTERKIAYGHTNKNSVGYKTHLAWVSMKQRCLNKNTSEYHRYGGRGIIICDRWLNSYKNFFDDMGLRPDGMSLERINNDGNYEPSNCKWATRKEQQNNNSRNRLLTCNGITMNMTQWANKLGMKQNCLVTRITRRKWSVERALNETPNFRRNKFQKSA